jgi:hypothetical protein
MLAATGTNFSYINSLTEMLLEKIDLLSFSEFEHTQNLLKEIRNRFDKERGIILLSISYTTVNKISDSIDSTIAYLSAHDEPGFENAKAILKNAVLDLSRLDRFSPDNIL